MADGKRWFKVWTSILSDPSFDELKNEYAGVWVKLGALIAKHGCNGNISVTKQQFLKRTNSTEKELDEIQTNLRNVNIDITASCNGNISVTFTNWRKYQVNTDSYERVKKWREKHSVTKVCNASKEKEKDKDKEKEKDKEKKKNILAPNFIDSELWNSFLSMRKQLRKPATYRAQELLIDKLRKFKETGIDPNDALKQSIERGYTGIFEPSKTRKDEYL